MSRSKAKGTKWESRLVDFLRQSGHQRAERRASNGVNDRGDVAGIDSWVIEAKNAARIELGPWCDEAEREAKAAGVARWAVVFPRRSHSAAKAFAVVPLWLLAELMREDVPVRTNDGGPFPPCCDEDYGGSHYHCGHCREVTSMMGHYVEATYRDGTPFEGHTCAAGVRTRWDGNRMYVEPLEATP